MGKVYVGPKIHTDSIELETKPKLSLVSDSNVLVQEKVVEKIIEVPVERIVEKIIEIPVDREVIVEKIVEVPVDREVLVERIVEKPIIVEKIVEVPVERVIEVRDFVMQKSLQQEISRIKFRNRLSLMALAVLIILNMLPR